MNRIFLTQQLRTVLLLSFILASGCGMPQTTPTPTIAAQTATASSPIPSLSPATATAPAQESLGLLFVNPDNRRYFTDGVKVDGQYRSIYLTGAHTWCNFMDCGSSDPPAAFDYDKYLDFLQANHLNFFRLWRAENARGGEQGPDFWFNPMPYQRSSECCTFDGGNKFDLEKFNQEYFDRMRSRIIAAGDRGIYVSIMLFDGWSVESKFGSHQPWPGHPYNAANNINNINGDVNGNGQGDEIHKLASDDIVNLEEAYVRKVIDTINDLDNVLYEISNESTGGASNTAWQYHLINYIKSYEAGKPKQHPVGMTKQYPGASNPDLYASPADWISPDGDVNNPSATDGSKVILYDTDHLCGICGDPQWVWKSFTRGHNPLFMDPYDPSFTGRGSPSGYDPNNNNDVGIRKNMGYARDYANRMNLTAMTPQPNLCSTGYCLANTVAEQAEYLVYLPAGAEITQILSGLGINRRLNVFVPRDAKVTVDLSASPVELLVEWFNPQNGTIIDGGTVHGGNSESFVSPFSGDAVLYIHNNNR